MNGLSGTVEKPVGSCEMMPADVHKQAGAESSNASSCNGEIVFESQSNSATDDPSSPVISDPDELALLEKLHNANRSYLFLDYFD